MSDLSPCREKRKYCGHCDDFVALRTYRNHVKLFYNTTEGRWNRTDESSSEDEGEKDDTCNVNEEHEGTVHSLTMIHVYSHYLHHLIFAYLSLLFYLSHISLLYMYYVSH